MGHTVPQMRIIIYDKMAQLKRLSDGLREPQRSAAHALISHIYQNISAISYANPLPQDIENNLIFSMLMEEKNRHNSPIENLTLLCFSLMVGYKARIHDARNTHRLLPKERQHHLVGENRHREYTA